MTKTSKAMLITLVCFLSITSIYSSDVYPYISPGVKLGFGKGGLTFTPKISLGVNTVFAISPVFINITYGRNITITEKNYPMKNGFRFIEVEAGVFEANNISFGGGAGIAFPVGIKSTVIPKFSLFGGYVAFIRTDHVMYKKKVYNDFGVMIVAPFGTIFFLWD